LSEPADPRAPWWERGGSAALIAAVWSGLAALSSARRAASDGDVSAFVAWSFCAASIAPFMVVSISLLRSARSGATALGGDDLGSKAIGFAAWLAVMTGALARFGAVLRERTHHHALAGATFALGALVLGAIAGMLAARLVGWVSASPTHKRVALVFVSVLALLVVRELARGLGALDPLTRAWVVDVTIASLCAVFGALTPSLTKLPARLGWLALAALLVAGWRGATVRELGPRLSEHAPLYGAIRARVP